MEFFDQFLRLLLCFDLWTPNITDWAVSIYPTIEERQSGDGNPEALLKILLRDDEYPTISPIFWYHLREITSSACTSLT